MQKVHGTAIYATIEKTGKRIECASFSCTYAAVTRALLQDGFPLRHLFVRRNTRPRYKIVKPPSRHTILASLLDYQRPFFLFSFSSFQNRSPVSFFLRIATKTCSFVGLTEESPRLQPLLPVIWKENEISLITTIR